MQLKKRLLPVLLLILLAGCGYTAQDTKDRENMVITQEEAKEIMDTREDYVLLDVREKEEYDQGHIEGALLLPYASVEELAETMLPDKDKTVLIYCRSGRRSAIAATALADLGYTDVKDFGGILDWTYEVVK